MDLVKANTKALVVAKHKGAIGPSKKKVNVLDEETYTEKVEEIIEKDFYPELSKMKAQAEYFEALEKNDLVKLRELEMRYSKRPDTGRSMYSTPATFETPDHSHAAKDGRPGPDTGQGTESTDNIAKDKPTANIHLDTFFSKNTSEDNESFVEILAETQKKHREKHSWLFENEESRTKEEEDRLALPSVEEQAAITDGQAGVDTWKYKTRNALMYVPEGEDYSASELVELKKKKPRKIVHDNTRFHNNPWNSQKSKETLKQVASEKALLHSGKIGHDGKETEVSMTPRVRGYGFVATPSPAPGVDESPLMTWGEVEGTPFQLDPNETPIAPSSAPAFKIPDIPSRDKIALELAEKASKQHRDKKENALKLASRLASPLTGSRSSQDRINSLSPAAQKLFGQRLGVRTGTDKALRASYSPSPSRNFSDKTPKVTPRRTPNKTPGSTPSINTPGSSEGSLTPGNKRSLGSTSLTDNLLQLPKKRPKATDFF